MIIPCFYKNRFFNFTNFLIVCFFTLMDKKHIFNETKAYEDREKYSIKDIYNTCLQSYTNFKTLNKIKEYGLPNEKYDKCGIIPELSLIWYAYNYRLSFYKYESNEYEEIPTFTSKVLFVDIFIPKKDIFNSKILYCLVVITENQVIIYGIDKINHSLINTNFVTSTSSLPICYCINNGCIFIGCEDGNVYEVIYKSLDAWVFRMMYLYSPDTSVVSNLVPSFFKRKKPRIVKMSASSKYLIVLRKNITIYNVEGGIFKVREISLYKEYVDCQIICEKYGDVFFYCVKSDGTRDFYDTKHLYSKECFVDLIEKENLKLKTYDKRFIILKKNRYQGSIIHFISFNEFQILNIDRNKSNENQELLSLADDISDFFVHENFLYLISKTKILFFEILTLKRFVTCSKIDEVFNLFKNLGIREGLAMYFELCSVNSDISKLEYLCVKIDENHLKGLFSFIYRQLKPFLEIPIFKIFEDESLKLEMTNVAQKFKNLVKKLKQHELVLGVNFMDYFVQSVNYVTLLFDYNIDLQNITFFRLLINDEVDFKKTTLNSLMDIHKTNNCLDSLINILSNKSKDYLPINEIYYHKGFDLIKKYPSKDKLWESLKNFKNVPFNIEIIKKYEGLKFYTGSVILIRKHFNKKHEETVNLLISNLKCNGAITNCLEDKREDFLYAFFDALIAILLVKDLKTDCACCEIKTNLKLSEVIKLESKFLSKYLKEKSVTNSNPLIYELYWKYCAYRDDRVEAVKALIYLIDDKNILLDQRIDLLKKAKTVSLHSSLYEEIKKRINLMEIQLELINRGENSKSINIKLLSADVLFNDYSYKYPDLALKIIDQSSFKHKNIINNHLRAALDGDFKSSVKFLISNKFEGSVLDCELIGNILLEKMTKDDVLSKNLLNIGFSYQDVQNFIENKIKKEEDLEFRNFLLEDFRISSDDKTMCKKLEQYCVAKN